MLLNGSREDPDLAAGSQVLCFDVDGHAAPQRLVALALQWPHAVQRVERPDEDGALVGTELEGVQGLDFLEGQLVVQPVVGVAVVLGPVDLGAAAAPASASGDPALGHRHLAAL